MKDRRDGRRGGGSEKEGQGSCDRYVVSYLEEAHVQSRSSELGGREVQLMSEVRRVVTQSVSVRERL